MSADLEHARRVVARHFDAQQVGRLRINFGARAQTILSLGQRTFVALLGQNGHGQQGKQQKRENSHAL